MERKLKDSGIPWIGQIPEHWEKIRCGLLFTSIGSGTTPTAGAEEYYRDGTVNWLQTGDLNDGVITETSKKITDFAVESKSLKIYPHGSVVIAMYGATIAKLGLLNINTAVNQACCVLEKSEKIISLYAFYFFYAAKTWLISLASGGGQPNISQATISNFSVIVPPLSEQESIAAYLDKKCGEIDELIEVEQQMISDLESYRQAVITEAVTNGLNPNALLRDSDIPWIGQVPEHWTIAPLKRYLLSPLMYGANEPSESDNRDYPRYIRITDIDSNGKLKDDTFKSLHPLKATPYLLKKGDILFARSGATVGKTYLFNENYDACFAGYLIKATCTQNIMPKYLYYYTCTNSYENWKNSIFIKATIQNIGADKYCLLPLVVPPLSEQQEIADYLDAKCADIDELVKVKQEKIETLRQYRQSLIFEAVTGKINIPL